MRSAAVMLALALAAAVRLDGQGPTTAEADTSLQRPPATSSIDEILEADEEVLEGTGYNYDAGNRRDPFKSLLIGQERPEFKGPRPPGIPGLLIDELTLSGIFSTAKGLVAQVQVSNKEKSYLLKVGDQLFDGDVVRIGGNEVVFKQIVNDATALKPFREVVKKLNP